VSGATEAVFQKSERSRPLSTLTASTPSLSRVAARIAYVATRPWLQVTGVFLALAVSLWSFGRVHGASWTPALLGLLPWIIGKYILCPLRWHALSASGRSRRWHLRIYAESELLGLASPAHLGADLWRMHRLQKGAGMARPCAVAEVALDRLVGALGLTAFVLISGASLPPRLLVAAVGIALGVLVAAVVVQRRRPGLLAGRPMPAPSVVIKGVLLSMGYQITIMGLLIGTVSAMGEQLHPMALLGVFGASQAAGIVPGVNGASAREGALVVGIASLGITWQAAVGAVALTATLAWMPALLLGGGSFAVRRLLLIRAAHATA
jgi:glycosyltransferase 2 family protein